ncbi:hypothetical protein [Pseudoruegeria sp. SHC-113]|nr:hypothetical protein [Pseudoruegeria sp. SHC-113]MCT8159462.1 hypothetical protein [Pseudoruegeria sp. SHC-113]
MFRGDNGGVLLRVEGGVLIAHDSTGVSLRLSDSTLADLRARLGISVPRPANLPPHVAGLDCWNVTAEGDWLRFDARIPPYDHPRGFRAHLRGGGVLADGAGPMLGLFSIGGARRAMGRDLPLAFPCHVVSADDDIGAVGMAGVEPAPETDLLHPLREATQDALVADALLAMRQAQGQSLPLIVARAETESAHRAQDLASGLALDNLKTAIHNFTAAAATLGRPARVLAVTIDFGAEDVLSDAASYEAGIRALVAEITGFIGELGLHEPLFLLRCDESGARVAEHWALSVFPAATTLSVAGPDYPFERDGYGRYTEAGARAAAALEAHVLCARLAGTPWAAPRLLLAERVDAGRIRVTAEGLGTLHLEANAKFPVAGKSGFVLTDAKGKTLALSGVAIAEDDPRSLVLSYKAKGTAPLTLSYARGSGGLLCDDWRCAEDPTLRRWALPAILEVR